MELLLVLSNETSNNLDVLLPKQFHIVMGMWNALKNIWKKEEKARKEQEEKQSSSTPNMSMPSMTSLPSNYNSLLNSIKR